MTECCTRCFNPRSRAGSDTSSAYNHQRYSDVSIHAPARGATSAGHGRCLGQSTFQSTLPRGERRQAAQDPVAACDVSIHAPARGATCAPISERVQADGSFNPRSRAGSDLMRSCTSPWPIGCFNPRSRAGSDVRSMRHVMRIGTSFNPRSRAGSDGCAAWTSPIAVSRFNPRSRAGSDLRIAVHPMPRSPVSIHAPARGATRYRPGACSCRSRVSIHAPARGATAAITTECWATL